MAFNLKKMAQMQPADMYKQRFEDKVAPAGAAVLKNGKSPEIPDGGVQMTPDTTEEASHPIETSKIEAALSEITKTGNLSEQTRSNPEVKAELSEILENNSPQFTDFVKYVGANGNVKDLYNFVSTLLENNSPLLVGDPRANRQQAQKYLALIKEYRDKAQAQEKAQPQTNAPMENNTMNPMADNVFNLKKVSESANPKTSYEKEDEKKDTKKGHGGNPFRVLMGMVGKLLDKGWNQQDIIRHVKRHTKFQAKTIKECVKIMKQYNKKKERDKREEPVQAAFNFREVTAATAIDRAEREWEKRGIYDLDQDFNKKSTRELIIRLKYLTDANDYDDFRDNGTRNNGPQGSLTSVDTEIAKVKEAMRNRGYSDEDITHEEEIIHENRYYPLDTEEGES